MLYRLELLREVLINTRADAVFYSVLLGFAIGCTIAAIYCAIQIMKGDK